MTMKHDDLCKVRHVSYGEGRVIQIRQEMGSLCCNDDHDEDEDVNDDADDNLVTRDTTIIDHDQT